MNKYIITIVVVIFLSFAIGISVQKFLIRSGASNLPKITKASSITQIITSQEQWQAGLLDNIDTTSIAGSLKMNIKTGVEQDITGASASAGGEYFGDPMKMLDSHCRNDPDPYDFGFGGWSETTDKTLTINLGELKTNVFFQMTYFYHGADISFATSANGIDWIAVSATETESLYCGGRGTFQSLSFSGSYIKMTINKTSPSSVWEEFKLYKQAARHVSTVDGGESFWDWETFTPTQTVPANTSVTYRYRSSADGTSWNSWHSGFGDVESRSGDTKYRYLQVEATLSNTDGASTPTIDAYQIDYHTNQKPGAPTAQTAVVQ